MGAFRRRTQFAAPLIISVAAAGCGSKEATREPPKQRFSGPMWSVTMRPPNCEASQDIGCARGLSCNPPAPQDVECPPGASGTTVTRIAEIASGRCAILPPGCFEAACAKTPAPCPLPHGEKLVPRIVFAWKIEKRGEGCHAEEEDHDCPPGVDCNPPKPRMVPCPPGITEEIDVNITQLADGTCAVVPDGCTKIDCVTDKTPCPPVN